MAAPQSSPAADPTASRGRTLQPDDAIPRPRSLSPSAAAERHPLHRRALLQHMPSPTPMILLSTLRLPYPLPPSSFPPSPASFTPLPPTSLTPSSPLPSPFPLPLSASLTSLPLPPSPSASNKTEDDPGVNTHSDPDLMKREYETRCQHGT